MVYVAYVQSQFRFIPFLRHAKKSVSNLMTNLENSVKKSVLFWSLSLFYAKVKCERCYFPPQNVAQLNYHISRLIQHVAYEILKEWHVFT